MKIKLTDTLLLAKTSYINVAASPKENIVKVKQASAKVITLYQKERGTTKQAKVVPMFT